MQVRRRSGNVLERVPLDQLKACRVERGQDRRRPDPGPAVAVAMLDLDQTLSQTSGDGWFDRIRLTVRHVDHVGAHVAAGLAPADVDAPDPNRSAFDEARAAVAHEQSHAPQKPDEVPPRQVVPLAAAGIVNRLHDPLSARIVVRVNGQDLARFLTQVQELRRPGALVLDRAAGRVQQHHNLGPAQRIHLLIGKWGEIGKLVKGR